MSDLERLQDLYRAAYLNGVDGEKDMERWLKKAQAELGRQEAAVRIDELQRLNRDIFGDLVTAEEIKRTISKHIAALQAPGAGGTDNDG